MDSDDMENDSRWARQNNIFTKMDSFGTGRQYARPI